MKWRIQQWLNEMGTTTVIGEVLQRYHALDHKIRVFRVRTGLRCPPQCGICCESHQVEASVLECLPLAWQIFRRGEAERVCLAIETRQGEGDFRCVLFAPDEGTVGIGRCRYYSFRPLVCRLFGYAARRNKAARPELRLCKIMREKSSENPVLWGLPDVCLMDPPVYQDCFYQVASIDPAKGFRLLPINVALKAALDHVYWQCPKDRFSMRRKAA